MEALFVNLIKYDLPSASSRTAIPRVCAVSYLNTVPLVWGFLRDPALGERIQLEFALPSVSADRLRSGAADIGIVPVIEMARQNLDSIDGVGISSDGPVRSILLISKVPFKQIKTLATDSGSRTSVMLARIILAERHQTEPKTISQAPDLAAMLGLADAALLIGDAALKVNPATLPFECLDLGEEWTQLTGLPMVFALWSGAKGAIDGPVGEAFRASCRYGLAHMDDIVNAQTSERGFPEPLVREYLTRHIVFELTGRHYAGLEQFLKLATALDRADTEVRVTGGALA